MCIHTDTDIRSVLKVFSYLSLCLFIYDCIRSAVVVLSGSQSDVPHGPNSDPEGPKYPNGVFMVSILGIVATGIWALPLMIENLHDFTYQKMPKP